MPLAEQLPIAQVRIESPLPHLDRVFDYGVPAPMSETAQPGVRVRVRFAGRLVGGFIVGRAASSAVPGDLRPLERVVSPEVVLTPEVRGLVEAVAERYAGTFSDVVRMAVPPRHARAEGVEVRPTDFRAPELQTDAQCWAEYRHGAALHRRIAEGTAQRARAVWSAAPARRWTSDVAALVRPALARDSGGVVVVVPDAWDVEQLAAELADCRETTAILTADLGPERRYREFCRVLRGGARLVIGTRTAVFAPMPDLALMIVWDDGDELLWEPHAPYWNARDVAAVRSHLTGCALVVGSPGRSADAQQWCETGWAISLAVSRTRLRGSAPVVRGLAPEDEGRDEAAASARIPRTAWLVAKEGVRTGPVLIQVARRGYLPVLACQRCHLPATCGCGGPLARSKGAAAAQCTWCGTLATAWRCASCGGDRMRAGSVGVERTAEEFGRAFPGERIVWSAGDHLVRTVPDEAAIVVATPGAEPVAAHGYAAVVVLDARSQLLRPSLRAIEDAAHRWFAALLLARPGVPAIVTADNASAAVQALARWDAPWLAGRELADRALVGLPPATRAATLHGAPDDIAAVCGGLSVPHRILGPVDGRAIVLAPREAGAELARELRAITATRSAKAALGQVSVRLDPRSLDA